MKCQLSRRVETINMLHYTNDIHNTITVIYVIKRRSVEVPQTFKITSIVWLSQWRHFAAHARSEELVLAANNTKEFSRVACVTDSKPGLMNQLGFGLTHQ